MRLVSLALTQFRNHASLQLDLSGSSLHVFAGPNASGKTNLLDAVALLSQGKSFLGLEEEDLVRRGNGFYRIRATVEDDRRGVEVLEAASELQPRRRKACFRNDVKIPLSAMVGLLPTVIFLPQDLEVFGGPPALRRRFLDETLVQVSPAYYRALTEYQKVLKQRNTLLRKVAAGEAKAADLDPWDGSLAERGAELTVARLELMEMFALTFAEELRTLGEDIADVGLVYRRSGEAREAAELSRELLGLLAAARDRDILLQATSAGPHRDDWDVIVAGTPIAHFASRGQQRSAVLALLFLRASFLELRRAERPIILLDDVFSELDDRHRMRVLEAFPDHQVLLTTTHLLPDMSSAAVWKVEEGNVRNINGQRVAAPRTPPAPARPQRHRASGSHPGGACA